MEMKSKAGKLMITVVPCLVVLLTTSDVRGQEPTTPAVPTTTYSIHDLGTLGGDNSIPYWITNRGDVIGVSDTGQFDSFGNPIDHAFRWRKGIMRDLGTLGDVDSVGLGGNNRGAVVGNNSYNINHALLWYNGAVADLGTLVGSSGYSWAQQINNAGKAVGGSAAADGTFHAVLWNQGAINDLGTLGGPNTSTHSLANGINNRGQIVGDAQENNIVNPLLGFPPYYPTIWDEGTAMKLGGEPKYAFAGDAFNINNEGTVVGRIAVADSKEGAVAHAYVWDDGVMHDLGVPAGDDNSEALSLNDRGQIVGDSGVGTILGYTPDHALLWQNGSDDDLSWKKGWIDLNTLIAPDSGYYLIQALDVNARGEIVVRAVQQSTGNIHAALLEPQELDAQGGAAMAVAAAPSKSAPRMSVNARRLLGIARRSRLGHVEQPR
jgi:probable HAF family extracellular repeat protein